MKIRKSTWALIGILAFIVLASALAPVLAPYDPNAIDMARILEGPSMAHWLGTDNLGRDVLSRVMYGGRQSMLLAVIATSCSLLLGMTVGVLAGYFGGIVDTCLTIVSNIFQGLPGTTLMIAIAGIMRGGINSLLLSLVLTSWVSFSRLARGETMAVCAENFIEGERSVGSGSIRIILRNVVPNIIGNLAVVFTTRVGRAVLSVASLSFLGLGLQPPTPDWGVMISDARGMFRSAPLLLIAPGVCIFVLSMCINLLGDTLRDYMDVRSEAVRRE